MKEIPNSPFRPGELLGESRFSNIWTHDRSGFVVKEWKPGFPYPFDSIEEVKAAISQLKEDLKSTQEKAPGWGVKPETFTDTDYVIHAGPERRIVYSRVQNKIDGLRTLADEKGRFVQYPTKTLEELKGIFKMAYHSVAREGDHFDIAGSTNRKIPRSLDAFRIMFPLLFSTNITIDQNKNIHLIDFEIHRPVKKQSVKRRILRRIEMMGTSTSVAAIDAILLARKAGRSARELL